MFYHYPIISLRFWHIISVVSSAVDVVITLKIVQAGAVQSL